MNIILFSELKDKHPNQPIEENIDTKLAQWVFYKDDDRYLHIKKILGLNKGDFFKAGRINGKIGEGKIISFNENKIVFLFEEKQDALELPKIKIILGFPRPIQLKRILRDIASLGFSELFLTGTELGEASYLKSNLSSNEQIRKYLLDGIMQAGQPLLPNFSYFPSVKVCLENLKPEKWFLNSKKILMDIDKKALSLNNIKISRNEHLLIAIGSERGWTDKERKLFFLSKFSTYSMGKRILRTETATVSALSLALAKAGYWE